MKNIRKELLELKDEEYGKFQKKLCPDTNLEIIGIRIPKLRNLAKELAEEDYKYYINSIENKYFEEIILEGLIIGYCKVDIYEKLKLIKEFVPKIDSWSITDTFCPTLKIKEKDLEKVWDFIMPYLKSNKEFEVRFAIIMMLDYYITDQYVDEVIECLDKVDNEGYYAKMAVAWTLAEIGIKYYDKLIKYLKGNNKLDTFTYNKTLQKLRESYRISSEQKEELKKMKRI